MGKLKVHVAVRTWGLPAMLDTLTVDVEDGVSEGSFKVRMVMMLLLVGVMRATVVWRGWDARIFPLWTRFACLPACSFGRLVDGLKGKDP